MNLRTGPRQKKEKPPWPGGVSKHACFPVSHASVAILIGDGDSAPGAANRNHVDSILSPMRNT